MRIIKYFNFKNLINHFVFSMFLVGSSLVIIATFLYGYEMPQKKNTVSPFQQTKSDQTV
jgi:hypothetical protein